MTKNCFVKEKERVRTSGMWVCLVLMIGVC